MSDSKARRGDFCEHRETTFHHPQQMLTTHTYIPYMYFEHHFLFTCCHEARRCHDNQNKPIWKGLELNLYSYYGTEWIRIKLITVDFGLYSNRAMMACYVFQTKPNKNGHHWNHIAHNLNNCQETTLHFGGVCAKYFNGCFVTVSNLHASNVGPVNST